MHRQVSQTTKHQLRIDQHSLRRGYLAPGTGVGGWVVGDLLLPMLRLPARTPHAPTSRLLEEWRCKSLAREISNPHVSRIINHPHESAPSWRDRCALGAPSRDLRRCQGHTT